MVGGPRHDLEVSADVGVAVRVTALAAACGTSTGLRAGTSLAQARTTMTRPSMPRSFALCLPVLLALAACSPGGGDSTGGSEATGGPSDELEPPGELVESSKAREAEPEVSAEDLAQMAADERAFGAALFAALPANDSNRAVSPTSVRFAFAQTYAGARTISKTEIETAVKFSLPPERLHPAFNRIDLELATREMPASGEIEGDDSLRLALVNQVFGRVGIAWEPAFLDVLAESYGSSMRLLDFGDSEGSRAEINGWVSGVTRDKIPELLPMGAIFPEVTTVLVNALYLKAPWATGFESVDEAGVFTRLDDSKATVAMMYGRQDGARHLVGDGFEAAEIPFRGGQLAMVVIVPAAGSFDAFAAALDGPALGEVFAGLQPTDLDVSLPRFKFSTDLALKAQLMKLGMVSSFELGGGDFSGMASEGDGWAIADVYHDVFVAVDEKGVEAAAASAVVVFDSGDPGAGASFVADRPFVFAIRDRGTDSLLFLGRVLDPSKE